MVQARFRGSRARSTITAHRVVHDERRRAATKIQAVRRGKAARAELQQRDEIQALLQEEEEDDDEDGDDKEELDGSGGEAPWDGGVANLGSRLPHLEAILQGQVCLSVEEGYHMRKAHFMWKATI